MARNKFDIDETLETPFDIRHFARALKYVGRYKKQVVTAMIVSVTAAVIGLCSPLITQYALDVTIPAGDRRGVLLLSGLLLLSIIAGICFSVLSSRIMTKAGQNMIYDIRRDLFEHLQKLPFEYYDSRPHGKILTRVINYVNSVADLLSNGLITFVLEIFNIIFIMIFMFAVSPRLAPVVLAGVPFFAAFMIAIKKAQRRAWQRVSNKSSNLNAYLHEGLVGVSITRSFVREEENEEIFDRLAVEYRKAWMRAIYFSQAVWPVADIISICVSSAIYLVGLMIVAPEAGITVGTIVAMTGYAGRFWQPIMNLSQLYNTFVNTIAYLERIFETMDEPVTVTDKENAAEMPEIKGDVSFKNVTFAYEEGANVLENLSFDVKAGQSIALVGPTGAGKTTIVNLISRFYNVNGGQVLIDGKDITDFTLKSLRSQMGIMLQDSVIFSGTIKENILYGRPGATDEEVRQACHVVGADEFINEMPGGFDTEVNERGASLSQGQRQMIAFARTILADPKILVLDEATSSIDAKTERFIQSGIDHLLHGRTSFIIAHRLSTIRSCDKIMYISEKGISECGTHDELMEKKGLYYKLCMAQSV
ncbi:MAG: ABC transporter ATP-binding protein/permease [Oscillospiraceae bacterium]|nr:ABC transporter ATP-binding protein/permease [Oscillospiraceae bacterium]